MGELILVVDDQPQNLKLVRILLSLEGYDVRTAQHAEDALKQIEAARPRLILMDLQLPGMDGLTLARLLKSTPQHRDIIIIALTAYAMKGDREMALSAGCDDYVTKPIDGDALQKLVATHLAKRA